MGARPPAPARAYDVTYRRGGVPPSFTATASCRFYSFGWG